MILPNAANQCSACLCQEVDLKGILRKGPGGGDLIIHQCRQCRLFARTPTKYVNVDLESPELMAICLKHIPALAPNATPKLNLVDTMYVWTEPNSMRIRLRLTVRTEVSDVMIQQRCVVEFIIRWKQCPDCNREYTNRTWQALVQLRQRRDGDAPRKGLAVLEMALARNAQIRKNCISVDTSKQGFDFYFLTVSDALSFSSYLARVAPLKIKTTKKLVSADVKSNTANMKYTVACDMVPLCRDDLVLVHKGARGCQITGRLALVTKMSSVVQFVDASPRRDLASIANAFGELAAETYYKNGGEKMYRIISSSRRMTRFVVLDIELCSGDNNNSREQQQDQLLYEGPKSGIDKHALADVEVVRESDFGQNDETLRGVTHLGNLLQVGDVVLGYDLTAAVITGGMEWAIENKCLNSSFIMPDIVLVKKVQGGNNSQKDDEEEHKPTVGRAKSGRAKKREKRNLRDEKKTRELEEAAGRMGFLDTNNNQQQEEQQVGRSDQLFKDELTNDPELAEELLAAERELAGIVIDDQHHDEHDNDVEADEDEADQIEEAVVVVVDDTEGGDATP
jgi:nonsense-mediated mRNA decay protein 3